jgi:hypothetical protein
VLGPRVHGDGGSGTEEEEGRFNTGDAQVTGEYEQWQRAEKNCAAE